MIRKIIFALAITILLLHVCIGESISIGSKIVQRRGLFDCLSCIPRSASIPLSTSISDFLSDDRVPRDFIISGMRGTLPHGGSADLTITIRNVCDLPLDRFIVYLSTPGNTTITHRGSPERFKSSLSIGEEWTSSYNLISFTNTPIGVHDIHLYFEYFKAGTPLVCGSILQ